MLSKFARDTSVDTVRPGRYAGNMDPDWWIVRGPNGGYVAALVLRAIVAEIGDPARTPRSLTVHYTRPPKAGPVEVGVHIERAGRTLSTVSARLTQDDRLLAVALAALAEDRDGPDFSDLRAPTVDPAERLGPAPPGPADIPFRRQFETRWALGNPPPGETPPGDWIGGWIRLADPEPVDHVVVAALTDAWAPSVFSRLGVRTTAPTIDLTVHFREPPPEQAEWCLVRFRSAHSGHGYVEEDGEVWSADGRLLAQSRQLAVLLPME
jgi:acyl-CoA thioesterase